MSLSRRDTLEQLLLAQAVYQIGSQDWNAVARLLNDHPLTKQQGDWNDINARVAYSDILESNPPFEPGILEPGANPLSFPPREKAALWVAQVAYKARMSDIKVEIQGEEDKFKTLVHEMESLKSLPFLSPSPSPSPPPPPPPRPPPPPPPPPKPKAVPAPAPWRNPKHGPNTHPKHAIPKTWGPNTHPKHAMPRPIGPNTHPKHAMPKGSNTHPKHAMPKPGQPPGTIPVKGVRGGKASYVHVVGDGKKGSPAAQPKASTSASAASASAVASTSKASTPSSRSPKILAFPPRKQSLAPSTPASTGSPLASTSFTAAALSRPASASASAAPSPSSSTTSSSRPTTSAYARRPPAVPAAPRIKAEPVPLTEEQLAAAEAKRAENLDKKAKERVERNEKKERDRKKKLEDRERWKKTRDEKRKREREERNALAAASGSSFVPPSPPQDEGGDDSFFAGDESFAQSREGSYGQDQEME